MIEQAEEVMDVGLAFCFQVFLEALVVFAHRNVRIELVEDFVAVFQHIHTPIREENAPDLRQRYIEKAFHTVGIKVVSTLSKAIRLR